MKSPFDRYKSRFLAAGGCDWKGDEWLTVLFNNGTKAAEAARMSRTILCMEFDAFLDWHTAYVAEHIGKGVVE